MPGAGSARQRLGTCGSQTFGINIRDQNHRYRN